MSNLKKKLNNAGGFTLVEMLIVVAIIAILIAISIPMVNSALEKSRDATDQANERAAKATVAIVLLDASELPEGVDLPDADDTTSTMYYDAVKGVLVKDAPSKGYGKCTMDSHEKGTFMNEDDQGGHVDQVIKITLEAGTTGADDALTATGGIDVTYEWE